MNIKGIPIENNRLNEDILLLITATSFALANADNQLIISYIENVFNAEFINNLKITLTVLNERMRKYFQDLVYVFCLSFDSDLFNGAIEVKAISQDFEVLVCPEVKKNKVSANFEGFVCSYCYYAQEGCIKKLQNSLKYIQSNSYR